MVCYPKESLPYGNNQNSDDEMNHGQFNKESRRRSFIAPFHGRNSSVTLASLSGAAMQALQKKRRSSMSDAQCLPLGLSNGSSSASSRIFDIGKNNRTPRSGSRTSFANNGRALLRSAFGSKKSMEGGRAAAEFNGGNGDTQPIISFPGGRAWKYLDDDREGLYLDLFWPIRNENPLRPDMLPLEWLAPLCNFRNLTFLKLTGMMRSYQKYIWQTVWLNPGLEVLELEMGLEPCIRRTFNADWPSIKGDWLVRTADVVHGSYYGDNGDGTLERRIGIGEYLDKQAIAEARIRAVKMGCSLRQLPIVKLSLTGFVVDADPFFYWFNPHRLRMIDFKNDCVDAGFALPTHMAEHVVVTWPRKVVEQAQYARVVRPGEIKLVDLGTKPRRDNPTSKKEQNKENKENMGNEEKTEHRKKPTARKIKKKTVKLDTPNRIQQCRQNAGSDLPRSQSNTSFNLFSVGRGFWKN